MFAFVQECACGGLDRALIDQAEVWLPSSFSGFEDGTLCLSLPEHWRPSSGLDRENDGADNGRETYQGEHCPVCNKLHFVSPKTSKVLGFPRRCMQQPHL